MKKQIKYSLIVFLIWVASPIILAGLTYFTNSSVLYNKFLPNLFIPGVVLSFLTYTMNFIKSKEIRKGLLYGIISCLVWVSPAIYFLPASSLFNLLSPILKFLVVFVPSAILFILFFYLGKSEIPSAKEFDELYTKKGLYSEQ